MTPDDVRKIFWYLKRKTSHTAWARAAAAFGGFCSVAQRQVMEEPAPQSLFGPYDWKAKYAEISQMQLHFQSGMERLSKGDRSAWLCDERGVMRDVLAFGSDWFSELIYGGQRGDHEYVGKYVDDMRAAIRQFDHAMMDVGYLQALRSDTPAPEYWGELMACVLNNELYPRHPEGGFPQKYYGSPLVFPHPLPRIPSATRLLEVSTGKPVAVDGIYAPQVSNGCMNYLLKDAIAPPLQEEGGTNRCVAWRLIWEDVRYRDGLIPDGERLYFMPQGAA